MEVFLYLIIVGFLGAMVWGFVSRADAKKKARERLLVLKDKFSKMNDFFPTQRVVGLENRYIFAIDQTRRIIAYVEEDTEVFIPFDKIINVEISEDNSTIASKSTSRTVGGALVGGALAGGAGAIVGGLSGDMKMKKKVSLVQVRIRLRDFQSPTLFIDCFDSKAMFGCDDMDSDGVGGWAYKDGLNHAKQITDLVSVIIDDVDRAEKQNLSSVQEIATGSVAEELEKLAALRDKGILTEDEFKGQKMKLLNK